MENIQASSSKPSCMKRERQIWDKECTVQLCREILLLRPYQNRKGSVESKSTWNTINKNMYKLSNFDFDVKAMRDHFNGIREKRKAELNKDKIKTGLGDVEFTELQVLLDEINDDIEKEAELHENETEAKRNAVDVEKAKATEVRQKAMETFGETRKRNKENGENEAEPSSKRRSGAETLRYLQERTEHLRNA